MYKYNDIVTFLVMEDSSLVMMNISYMKYDCPKKLETCTSGEQTFELYKKLITEKNTLYHFIMLGINMQKGLDGNDVMRMIRAYEKENKLPRT